MTSSTEYTAKQVNADGRIDYSDEENALWSELHARQSKLVKRYSADVFQRGLQRMALPGDRIPQCADVSERLRALTGWRVEPVPALIGFERFFSMLADRIFPAASFIRSREHFDYIEEPDIFHELFGHTPLLSDRRFAAFSQAIGKAGLLAARDQYAWLIRPVYTVEFCDDF